MRDWARRSPLVLAAALALPLTTAAAAQARTLVPLPPGSSGAPPNAWRTGVDPAVGSRSGSGVAAARLASSSRALGSGVRKLFQADLLVVAPTTLPRGTAAAVRRLPGVAAVQLLDAARIRVDGKFVAMLGVNPAKFRSFAARPTAKSLRLWQDVQAGGVAVSYTMGKMDKLPLGGRVRVAGRRTERLVVAGFGTVGIAGVDAVVSHAVARSLGIPAGNALVISAPHARLGPLQKRIARLLPRRAAIAPLVAQAPSSAVAASAGSAGAGSAGAGSAGARSAGSGPGMTSAEVLGFLKAAESRLGMPYVWGGDGPNVFDCSGLVQWSMARAGVVMPRVAADQARTGPRVPLSQLQPGDLLFYHTDPTAPTYISHVAIYLGNGEMIQAPEPGLDVEVVKADFGAGFAGAVRVYPKVAAAVAASLAG